jgi:hypothetical protein
MGKITSDKINIKVTGMSLMATGKAYVSGLDLDDSEVKGAERKIEALAETVSYLNEEYELEGEHGAIAEFTLIVDQTTPSGVIAELEKLCDRNAVGFSVEEI